MDSSEQFAKWMDQADKTLDAFAKESPRPAARPQPQTSFFNNAPSDAAYDLDEDGDVNDPETWNAIYQRAMEMPYSDPNGLLTEDGFGTLVRGDKQITKGDVTYFDKPQYAFGIGSDQGGEDGEGMRVTKNWSQGKELEQVAELGKRLEEMERKAHAADVLKKGSRDKLYKELKSLRSELRKLSEKLTSKPDEDVT